MSGKMRWRYGGMKPVMAEVEAETMIEIGDLIWRDFSLAKPPSEATSHKQFAANFWGVAMTRTKYGDTDPIRIATAGVFEFDCPPWTWEVGDQVGAASVGPRADNQMVVLQADAKHTIAQATKRVTEMATTVMIDIRSTVIPEDSDSQRAEDAETESAEMAGKLVDAVKALETLVEIVQDEMDNQGRHVSDRHKEYYLSSIRAGEAVIAKAKPRDEMATCSCGDEFLLDKDLKPSAIRGAKPVCPACAEKFREVMEI